MTKLSPNYSKCKIRVDKTEHDPLTGDLLCYCYTPCVPHALEPVSFPKTITLQELQAYYEEYIGEADDFDWWISNNKYSIMLDVYCTDLINQREKRTELYPTPAIEEIDEMIANIKSENEKWLHDFYEVNHVSKPAAHVDEFGVIHNMVTAITHPAKSAGI